MSTLSGAVIYMAHTSGDILSNTWCYEVSVVVVVVVVTLLCI